MMVTKATCDRCGGLSDNPGGDNWKQVRVYPIGAVFELCRQCAADTLEFIRNAPAGSPRALAKAAPPPEPVEFLDTMDPARASKIRHAEETGGDVAEACDAGKSKNDAAAKLADDIVSHAKPPKKPARVTRSRVR